MKTKVYAKIYNPVTNQIFEIGGTSESVKRDLKDMDRKGMINEKCSVEVYAVNLKTGKCTNLMDY